MKGLAWLCMLMGVAAIGNTIPDEEMPSEVPEAIVEEAQGFQVLDAQERFRITADEGLTVISSRAYLQKDQANIYYLWCVIYAEVRNDTDHTVYLNGRLEVKERLSKPITQDGAVTPFMPLRIEPGQTAYFGDRFYIRNLYLTEETLDKIYLYITDGPVNDLQVKWWGEPQRAVYQDDSVTVEPIIVPDWEPDSSTCRVSFVNHTGDTLSNPAVVAAAYDDQGRLLYVLGSGMAANADDVTLYVPDGSAYAIVDCIPGAVSRYMEENGIEVSEYRTVIYGNDITSAAHGREIVSLFGAEGERIGLKFETEDDLTVISGHVLLDIGPDCDNRLMIYAEIRNDGDTSIEPDATVYISDDTGEVPYDYGPYFECTPYTIQPGQTAYFNGWMSLDDYCGDRDIVGVTKQMLREVRVLFYHNAWWEGTDDAVGLLPVEAAVEEIAPPDTPQVWKMLRVTITNNTDEDLIDPVVAIGAYDAQGRLIYESEQAYFTGYGHDNRPIVPGGSSLIVDIPISDSVRTYMEACGLEAVEYRCIVN